MKKKYKIILGTILAFFILVVLVGLILPSNYEFQRSVMIKASPEEVHELVGDLKNWSQWEPWRDEDPTIKTTLGEKSTGVGASQSWKGESGDGRLVFTKCSIEEGITYDLFFDQDQYKCFSSMSYKKVEEGTEVTWLMKGNASPPILGSYFALMMESMIGKMFENGLEKLQQALEKK